MVSKTHKDLSPAEKKSNSVGTTPTQKVQNVIMYTPSWREGAGGAERQKGEAKLESQDRVVLSHGQGPLLFIPGM